MRIGLIRVDGQNFPNLALMKLSAWHKKQGDTVEFANVFDRYDRVYKSKIFTYTPDDCASYITSEMVCGGSGYQDYKVCLNKDIEHTLPDYSLFNCESAYGFLTRGCPNKCKWCVVPKKEGDILPHADIEEFLGGQKTAILLDNNVLASEHGIHQIEKIIDLGIRIDFNQGLDARIIAKDKGVAKLLAKVNWLQPLRLACDTTGAIEPVRKAVENLRWYNCRPTRYFVYLLVEDVADAVERVRFLKSMDLDPFAQTYMALDNPKEPTKEQADFCRWVNVKSSYKKSTWEEYMVIRKKEETENQQKLF